MNIQEGTVGAVIVAQVQNSNGSPRNIANATVKQFIFENPDGVLITKAVEFMNDGSDGLLIYTTLTEQDTMPPGTWHLQSYHEQPGFKGKSRPVVYFVLKNLV